MNRSRKEHVMSLRITNRGAAVLCTASVIALLGAAVIGVITTGDESWGAPSDEPDPAVTVTEPDVTVPDPAPSSTLDGPAVTEPAPTVTLIPYEGTQELPCWNGSAIVPCPPTRVRTITEDDPRWDCRTMGNLQCGVQIEGTWYVVTFADGQPVGVRAR